MIFGYFTLFVALLIEVVGAYYSITGLAAIFAGAVIPILIMGSVLEVGKVTAAVWLKNNWHRASLQFKLYLLPAVILLMFITSMGIFGFLSKAHNDQNLVSGDVQSKIAIYDEKIKIQKDNIESARRALQQMDSAVDQTMARSNDEKGAAKATAIRRGQARERNTLQKEITQSQTEIVKLNDQRAPIAAEVRKVEAEVGPIKYIAKMIYGDNPDANLLEQAVVWVIMMIVAVFDPLALVLILAAQQSIRWARGEDTETKPEFKFIDRILNRFKKKEQTPAKIVVDLNKDSEELDMDIPVFDEIVIPDYTDYAEGKPVAVQDPAPAEEPVEELTIDDHIDGATSAEKEAQRAWKEANPSETIKKYRQLHEAGRITELPWMHLPYYSDFNLLADNDNLQSGEVKGFGIQFPNGPRKGDMFLRVDRLPSVLYKFNGTNWIEVDKALSDQHAYDVAYIDHLIAKIESGEYDPELLSDAERASIEQRLINIQLKV